MNNSKLSVGRYVFKPTQGLVRVVGKNLYTRITAIMELVANGRDACVKKGIVPEIHINVFPSNSRYFKGETIVVTDYGCGFMGTEDWEEYLKVGESPFENREGFFGANGIGKFAALYFNPDGYTIRTCPDNSDNVQVLEVLSKDIFSDSDTKKDNFFIDQRGNVITDPKSGSFTSIIIEDIKTFYSPKQILQDLPRHLPIEPWIITVNNENVRKREEFGEAIEITTPSLPKIGIISCRIGVVEKASFDADRIMLLGGGRPICPLIHLPKVKDLDSIFLHPNLFGWISVEKWVKEATVAKDQLRLSASEGDSWNTFVKGLKLYFRQKLEEAVARLESVVSLNDHLLKGLKDLQKEFENSFGSPFEIIEADKDKGIGEKEKTKATRRKKNNNGESHTDIGNDDKKIKTSHPKNLGDVDGEREFEHNPDYLVLRIEDKAYQLVITMADELVPAQVRPGNIMVIASNHQRLAAIQNRGVGAFKTCLEQALIEAHLRYTEPGEGAEAFSAKVYNLLSQLNILK